MHRYTKTKALKNLYIIVFIHGFFSLEGNTFFAAHIFPLKQLLQEP